MHVTKKYWANIITACILLVAIIGLFGWYSAANDQRIKNKNLNYALDSARQTAHRVGGEFAGAG